MSPCHGQMYRLSHVATIPGDFDEVPNRLVSCLFSSLPLLPLLFRVYSREGRGTTPKRVSDYRKVYGYKHIMAPSIRHLRPTLSWASSMQIARLQCSLIIRLVGAS